MPFYYYLKFPDLESGFVLSEQLVPESQHIEANTALASLRLGKKRIVLRNAGRGVLTAWFVKPGSSATPGETFARISADGEEIPYGRPYLIVEQFED